MLSKEHRLKGEEQFSFLFHKGKKRHHEGFSLYFLWDLPPEQGVKIGVSVSKKVSKRAVDRNRVRRLFFEAIRPLVPNLGGLRMMVVARKKLLEMNLEEVRSILVSLLIEPPKTADHRKGTL